MGDRALSYDGLNKTANRIAHGILSKRGPASEPVALFFDHGIDVIAAILGVLKAGKFFIGLDPLFPSERIAYLLEDSQAKILLTNNSKRNMACNIKGSACDLLNIDATENPYSRDNTRVAIAPGDFAMILYTSGSTGKPKGVVKTHRYVLDNARLNTNAARVRTTDRLSLLHSICFGAAEFSLYGTLLNGAALFPLDGKSFGIEHLVRWLKAENISVAHFTPAVFRQASNFITSRTDLPLLRHIRLSGASIAREDFDLYREKFSSDTLLEIALGTTETGQIGSATVNHSFSFPREGSPCGYPYEGRDVVLVDDCGRAARPGEIGEINVKVRDSALGYWRDPELTKSKFLVDPNDSGGRMYATGDLGKLLPDGFLICLGRKDLMVKIRGYRVEIGEVEKALLGHPQVKDAGVRAWDHDCGDRYLAAYVVPRENASLTANALREFLKGSLPDYMIPNAFLFAQSLPLTNGKLDRRALPAPGTLRPALDTSFVAPQTPVEVQVAHIWSEILSLDQVGIHDNFFDLGGHSLAATRVVSQVIKHFEIDLPLQSLIQSPTVAEMAAAITEHQGQKVKKTHLDRILAELDSLSDEEAARLVADDKKGTR
jgi:amino acid adenylation domain-containing protein